MAKDKIIFSFIFLGVIFYLGLGENILYQLTISIFFILLIGIRLCKTKKPKVHPKFFNEYLLFLLFLLISSAWSSNINLSIYYFYIFGSSSLIWGYYANFGKTLKNTKKLIVLAGVLWGVVFISGIFLGYSFVENPFSIHKYAVLGHHHHIGDYWMIILLIAAYWYLEKTSEKISLSLIIAGVFFIFLSLSRSAYLSLFVGSLFLYLKLRKNARSKILTVLMFISGILFIYASTVKSTLMSHGGFFLQGLLGFFKNPVGLGMGNFEKISSSFDHSSFAGFLGGSNIAHNIVLEIVSGMGIFSIFFIIWLLKTLIYVLKSPSEENIIYRTIFIAITVNFMFDYTYLIIPFLWIWFISLALIKK